MRLSAKQIIVGLVAFVTVAALAGGGLWIASARKAAAENARLAAAAADFERRAAAVITKLGEGAIEDAIAALKRIPDAELAGSLRSQPALAVVQAAAAGDWEGALAKTSLVGEAKARPVVDTALAERALKALGADFDSARAASIASRIPSEPRRAQALDSAIGAEARRMIDANRFQDAKALIAILSSSTLREELEARIKARLE